ncbi:hypothetical protein PRZ48_002353 [Zasmidium cellare]|uniref:Uncharacterized protein n=1 Tax=Zasmidium cellare TaxID=395010 RepID=A0ABR0F3T2_ZASCE|nr:hypothetical protein PRZ48_002353 [Zasmidium cellare]
MNPSTASPASARLHPNNQHRRVLGDVSPNVRPAAPTGTPGGKMLSGSPLKRSFTAAMEGGQGFRYLKKRKFSIDSPLSQMMTAEEAATAQDIKLEPGHAHPANAGDQNDVPMILQLDPTRPNTPNSSANGDEDGQDSSADRRSFSSLINYDPSSQTAPSSQQPSGLVFNGPSYAEVLRLRLRLAHFKVRTNQIHVPLSDLHVEEDGQEPSAFKDATAGLQADGEPSASHRFMPKLLPAPILRPTPYSNRVIYDFPEPCSPPPADSPDTLPHGPTLSTPNSTRRTGPEEQELTSSIVKGRVAEGLLGLRNAF